MPWVGFPIYLNMIGSWNYRASGRVLRYNRSHPNEVSMPPLTSSAAPEGDSRNRRQVPDREVTEVLAALRRGEPGAESQLIALVYTELRTLARRYMGRERADHTLQPTALVHEAYIRLIRDGAVDLEDRVHFFAASARVMRHILIDHAR